METMKNIFLVYVLVVLVAVQAHGFFPFDSESEFYRDSEASEFSQEIQDFPWNTQSNSDETSLLSVSELPKYYEPSKFSFETQHFPSKTESNPIETSLLSASEFPQDSLETQNSPWKSSQSSESEFYSEFESPIEIDSHHGIKSPPPSPPPSPSETPSPSPAEAPHPPKHSRNTCKSKCSTKCQKEKFPLLHLLCNQVCKTRCLLHYSERIYNCTNHCVESMPKIFKSGKKREAGYVKYCYKKCASRISRLL